MVVELGKYIRLHLHFRFASNEITDFHSLRCMRILCQGEICEEDRKIQVQESIDRRFILGKLCLNPYSFEAARPHRTRVTDALQVPAANRQQ